MQGRQRRTQKSLEPLSRAWRERKSPRAFLRHARPQQLLALVRPRDAAPAVRRCLALSPYLQCSYRRYRGLPPKRWLPAVSRTSCERSSRGTHTHSRSARVSWRKTLPARQSLCSMNLLEPPCRQLTSLRRAQRRRSAPAEGARPPPRYACAQIPTLSSPASSACSVLPSPKLRRCTRSSSRSSRVAASPRAEAVHGSFALAGPVSLLWPLYVGASRAQREVGWRVRQSWRF